MNPRGMNLHDPLTSYAMPPSTSALPDAHDPSFVTTHAARATSDFDTTPPGTFEPARFPRVPGASRNDKGFALLLGAYIGSGGTAEGDALGETLKYQQRGDHASLARLLVARKVFGFHWRDSMWIPLFQFDRLDWSARPGLQQVLLALGSHLDGWDLATWFADANVRLGGRRPVEAFDFDPLAVLDAARYNMETGSHAS